MPEGFTVQFDPNTTSGETANFIEWEIKASVDGPLSPLDFIGIKIDGTEKYFDESNSENVYTFTGAEMCLPTSNAMLNLTNCSINFQNFDNINTKIRLEVKVKATSGHTNKNSGDFLLQYY